MVPQRGGSGTEESAWRAAERSFEHEVIARETLAEMFEATAERNADVAAQRYKGGIYDRSLAGNVVPEAPVGEYAEITYARMREVVRTLAAGFRDLGVEPGDRIAILANTRMEWALSDFALLAAGAVVTTVYTDSSPRQVRYLLDDPGATGVVVENRELLNRVREVEDDLDLSFVATMDEVEGVGGDGSGESDADASEDETAHVETLADVHARGDERFDRATYEEWLGERDPEDLASIIYTSGTTGRPKGVELSHWNFRVNVNQVYRRLGPRSDKPEGLPTLDDDTRSISFLPLAHVFERLAGHFAMFAAGATVGYAESADTVAEDIRALSPTTGASVPRVYERIYGTMREQASESPVKRRIFEWAVDVATEWDRTDSPGLGLRARRAVADRLVYSTVRERLGGNLEFMISGGGSLSKDLCSMFNGMGITVVEGYGLTETAPVASVNPPEDIRPGTLGVPVVDQEVAIDDEVVDAREFDDVEGEVGELLVRGPNVAAGYWNDPEATAAAFVTELPVSDGGEAVESTGGGEAARSADGGEGATDGDAGATDAAADEPWFRTGDIVERTDDGFLIYHDRLKQLLVLSTGKNVAPQPIEDRFSTSDRVDQIMVVGNERKFVGALIVPNFETLRRWADEEGIDLPADEEACCRDERVREWVQAEVDAVNADLERVEQIKEFELVSREWTAANDLLTPSMKKKRRNIGEQYDDAVDRIYEEG